MLAASADTPARSAIFLISFFSDQFFEKSR